ncbi:hypothetical protein [Sporosarcina sp. OR05]|uniref:hypothetical protein n=1 Tax=Sporosarcina sp. OR05 TaxID=2969819 RepID=UPI00352AE5D2
MAIGMKINEQVVPYGAGEWDTLLDGSLYVSTTGTSTPTVTSGGGDLRVCIGGVDAGNTINFSVVKASTKQIIVHLFDVNTGSTESEYKCLPKFDVRPYVDSNGKFDLYVTAKGRYSDVIRIVIED